MKLTFEFLEGFGNGKLEKSMTKNEFMKKFGVTEKEWNEAREEGNEYGTQDKHFNYTQIKDNEKIEDESLVIEINEKERITHIYY